MTILLKLASLHTTLDEIDKAVGYHRKVVALGEKSGLEVAEMAGSYLAVAEWEMKGLIQLQRRETREGKNLDRANWDGDDTMDGSGVLKEADLAIAAQYLERVAQTNAPQRDRAEELLRSLRVYEMRTVATI